MRGLVIGERERVSGLRRVMVGVGINLGIKNVVVLLLLLSEDSAMADPGVFCTLTSICSTLSSLQ